MQIILAIAIIVVVAVQLVDVSVSGTTYTSVGTCIRRHALHVVCAA